MSRRRMTADDCEYCEGRLHPREVTEVCHTAQSPVIIEGVPVRVCDGCGERYYPAGVLQRMGEIASNRRRIRRRISVPVARFSA